MKNPCGPCRSCIHMGLGAEAHGFSVIAYDLQTFEFNNLLSYNALMHCFKTSAIKMVHAPSSSTPMKYAQSERNDLKPSDSSFKRHQSFLDP